MSRPHYASPADAVARLLVEVNGRLDLTAAKHLALTVSLGDAPLRSLCWMLFLDVLPPSFAEWPERLAQQRSEYQRLRDRHLVDPTKCAAEHDDPLSEAEGSVWAAFFANEELCNFIRGDLARTYVELGMFQEPEVHDLLLRVLFVFAREHAEPSYRQGMHEILAVLAYVLLNDRKAVAGKSVPASVASAMASEHAEADLYALFSAVMRVALPWFAVVERGPDGRMQKSALLLKCEYIQDTLLRRVDPELHAQLARLEIAPQIYALRWVRLLVGREFHLDDVPLIWDALFADSPQLGLLDYVCVAMLCYLRTQLLGMDANDALMRMMRYPPVEDVRCFVEQAVAIRATGKMVVTSAAATAAAAAGSAGDTGGLQQNGDGGSSHGASSFIQSFMGGTASAAAGVAAAKKQRTATAGAGAGAGAGAPSKPNARAPPSAKASSSAASARALRVDPEVMRLQEHIRDLLDANHAMGTQLDSLVAVLQGEMLATDRPINRDSVFLAIASLKNIKNVLLGNLSADALVTVIPDAPQESAPLRAALPITVAELRRDPSLASASADSVAPPAAATATAAAAAHTVATQHEPGSAPRPAKAAAVPAAAALSPDAIAEPDTAFVLRDLIGGDASAPAPAPAATSGGAKAKRLLFDDFDGDPTKVFDDLQ